MNGSYVCYEDLYRRLAAKSAEEVATAAAAYAADPSIDNWARLASRIENWQRDHAAWRAMECHGL